MAAELITPVDEISGLPLPILPGEAILPINQPDIADWHHHFHPKEHPILKTTGGLALRNCRVQLVHRNFHNESPTRYHKFYDGPELPEEESEQFKLVVLACAGFLPEEAIDLRSGEPKVVHMDKKQDAQIRSVLRPAKSVSSVDPTDSTRSKIFQYRHVRYGYEPIRDFIAAYALEHDISHVNESLVDEFLYTRDQERKRFLGHFLLAQKVEVTAEEVRSRYDTARNAGLLHPLMPPTPTTLLKHKLGTPHSREALFPRLAAQLAFAKGAIDLTIRGERAIV
jgi:hypothetical protein